MKNLIILVLSIAFASCSNSNTSKDFGRIKKGMTKSEVLAITGEPTKKNDIKVAELWTYDAADRTIIFRKDTVYNIMTSSEARIDSIEASMKEVGEDITQGAKETGRDIEQEAQKMGDKIDSLRKK